MKLSPYLKKTIFNISWLTTDQVLRIGMNSLITIFIARYYGKEAFGIYSVSLATIMIFSPLISFGFDGYIIRDIISHPDKRDEILGSTFIFRLFGAVSAISIIYAIGDKLMPGNILEKDLLRVLSISFIFQPFDVVDLYFRSQLKAKYTVWSKTGVFILIQFVKIYCLINRVPIITFAFLYVLEVALGGIALLLMYTKNLKYSARKWHSTNARLYYTIFESWPLLISTWSTYLYMRMDQLLVGRMLGPASAGIYSASVRLYEMPVILINILGSSFFPILHDLFKKDKKLFFKRYSLITEIYTMIGYFIFIIVLIFGNKAILLFGKEFASGGLILKIQIFGLAIWFNSGLRSTYLAFTSNQKILLYSSLVSAILNIVFNILLIPIYGVIGSAYATVITYFLSAQLFNLAFKETRLLFIIHMKGFIPIEISKLVIKRLRILLVK